MRTRAACSARTAAARSITSACTAASTSRSARCRRRSARSAATSPAAAALIEFLYHRARPFLFSTSHPPAVAAACIAAHRRARWRSRRSSSGSGRTRGSSRPGSQALGFNTGLSESPITPVIVGDGALAMKLSDRLFEEGVFAQGIAFPTVARQGAGAHDRHRHAHARGAAVRARHVRQGRPGARTRLMTSRVRSG